MPRRLALVPLIAAVLALPACGDGDGSSLTPVPGQDPASASKAEAPTGTLEGSTEDVEVIRSWSEALTESDIEAAADLFAIPSTAENGVSFDIETVDDARFFNESLPCGATLEETTVEGDFITATFELTDRPGPGPCPGSGSLAQTSFVIEDGAITEWRRVALPDEQNSGPIA